MFRLLHCFRAFFGHRSSQRACSHAFSIRMLRLSHYATCLHIPHVVRLLLFECRIVYSLGVPHVHPYSGFSYSPNWIKCRFKSHEVGRTCEHSMCDNLERRQTICPNGTGACGDDLSGRAAAEHPGVRSQAYGCLQGLRVFARQKCGSQACTAQVQTGPVTTAILGRDSSRAIACRSVLFVCLSHTLFVPLCALCLALLPSASRIVVLFEQTSLIRLSFFVRLFRLSSLCLCPLFVLLLSSPCSFPGSPSCSFSFLSFSALSSSLLQKL